MMVFAFRLSILSHPRCPEAEAEENVFDDEEEEEEEEEEDGGFGSETETSRSSGRMPRTRGLKLS